MKHIRLFIVAGITACVLFACGGGMDEYYKDIVKDGEIRYASIVDSVTYYSGKYRAVISFSVNDANVSEVEVFWNNKMQSLKQSIEHVGKYSVEITDLKEQSYSFTLISYSKNESYSSMEVGVTGRIYGDTYQASLLARPIISASVQGGTVIILWGTADNTCIGTEVNYTNVSGRDTTVFVNKSLKGSTLHNCMLNTEIRYRSLYLPTEFMVDTFSTESIPVVLN